MNGADAYCNHVPYPAFARDEDASVALCSKHRYNRVKQTKDKTQTKTEDSGDHQQPQTTSCRERESSCLRSFCWVCVQRGLVDDTGYRNIKICI